MPTSETKWIGLSKTVLGAILMAAPALLAAADLPFTAEDAQTIQSQVFAAVDAVNEAAGFLLVVWGRMSAAKKVTLLPKVG